MISSWLGCRSITSPTVTEDTAILTDMAVFRKDEICMTYGDIPQRKSAVCAPATDDAIYGTRMPSSTRRYRPMTDEVQVVRSGNKQLIIHQGRPPQKSKIARLLGAVDPRVILFVGAVMALLTLYGASLIYNVILHAGEHYQYGSPPTSQLDAVVGHNDSEASPTHFVFLNVHGRVQIIEEPGGDASHARIYTGPTLVGDNAGDQSVTGEIVSEDGRHDLIVHVQDQQIVYINDGSTFHEQ